jgi:ferric-dicitrate binding protein FerR (iron transport regulator)
MTEQRMRNRNAENPFPMSRSTTITIPSVKAPHLRLGALVALGLAAFLIGWLILGGDDGGSTTTNGASARSQSELRDFAASSSHPVYWVGPREGQTYELTKTSDERVYVRYLPEGVKAGDPRPQFLTIGTYPRPKAYAELKRAAKAPGATSRRIGQGGLAVLSKGSSSVYFGYPDAAYQVEVYAPGAGEARRLVLDGQVVPIR